MIKGKKKKKKYQISESIIMSFAHTWIIYYR